MASLSVVFQSKLTGKNLGSEKDVVDNKIAPSLGSYHDMPYDDSDRKEKFKMVLGRSKKDGQDHPSTKVTQQQVGVSADAAAAILQAATRGIKNPNFDFLPKRSSSNNHGLSSEGGRASSFQSLLSSQPRSSSQKSDPNGGGPATTVSVPAAKAIANTAALAAASEADSSEAHLTKEQKLKAERLKRAKMFSAMIKGGGPPAAPLKTEPVRSFSVEPTESGVSGFGGSAGEALNLASKEREGSSVPVDVDTFDKTEKLEKKHSDTEHNELRSRRKYRSRSKKDDEEDDDEEEEEEEEENDEKEGKRDHKQHYRKKHHRSRSHHSSHSSRDDRHHKHRKRHSSSSKDRESQHHHKHEYSDDEHRRDNRRKRSKKSHSEKREVVDLEEGEISTKSSDQSKAASVGEVASREASMDLSNSQQVPKSPSQPSETTTTTQVSDDLRAKIRAMLLATL